MRPGVPSRPSHMANPLVGLRPLRHLTQAPPLKYYYLLINLRMFLVIVNRPGRASQLCETTARSTPSTMWKSNSVPIVAAGIDSSPGLLRMMQDAIHRHADEVPVLHTVLRSTLR